MLLEDGVPPVEGECNAFSLCPILVTPSLAHDLEYCRFLDGYFFTGPLGTTVFDLL